MFLLWITYFNKDGLFIEDFYFIAVSLLFQALIYFLRLIWHRMKVIQSIQQYGHCQNMYSGIQL